MHAENSPVAVSDADDPSEPQFDELTLAAALVAECSTAVVTLVEAAAAHHDVALCDHSSRDDDARFHAAYPVLSSTGTVLGALCVLAAETRDLTPTQDTLLEVLASQVAARLDLRRELLRRAETAAGLRESERRYRLLAELSSDIVSKHDLTGRVLYVSPSVCTVLGYDPEQEVSSQPAMLLHPDDLPALGPALTAARNGGTATATVRSKHADGSWRHLEMTLSPGRDASGAVVELYSAARDVTDRVAAATGRAFLETVLATIDVGIVACDADGHLTLFNDASRTFHGMPVDTTLDPADWAGRFDLYGADGTTAMVREQVPLYRALVEGQVTDVAMTIKAEGQPARMMRCDGRALHDATGTVTGAVVAMKDITASVLAARQVEQAHARAHEIVTTATDAFVSIDESGSVTDWNPQAEATFGYPAADALGRDLADLLIPAGHIRAHRGGLRRFLLTGEEAIFGRRLELTARHCDGHAVPIELTVWPTRTDGGWQFNAFLRDISERVAARSALDRAHAELAESAEFTRVLLDTIDVAIVACDAEGTPSYFNARGRLLFGLPPGPSFDGQDFPLAQIQAGRARQNARDVVTGEQLAGAQRALPRALREGSLSDLELEIVNGDGAPHRMLTHERALHAPDGSLLGAVCAAHDVTALRERERALQASETRFRAAFSNGPLAMARLSIDGQVLEPNPAMRRLLSLTTRQLRASSLLELSDAADALRARAALAGALATGSHATELRLLRADRVALWCDIALTCCTDSDGTRYVLAQIADMTDRKRHEQDLIEASLTDHLTGLRNREALNRQLQQWLAPDASIAHVAMFFADLDDFKSVNDALGHEAGDAVLIEVARRLRDSVRPQDLVVRLGGDELVVACADLPGHPQRAVDALTERLTAALRFPLHLNGQEARIRASVGSTLARPGQDAAAVLAEADRRMYQRKERTRGPAAAGTGERADRGGGTTAPPRQRIPRKRPKPSSRSGQDRAGRRSALPGVPADRRPAHQHRRRRRSPRTHARPPGAAPAPGPVHPRR